MDVDYHCSETENFDEDDKLRLYIKNRKEKETLSSTEEEGHYY